MTLTKLVKQLSLYFSGLSIMANNLHSARLLEDPGGTLEVNNCESYCALCKDEMVLISAVITGLFSDLSHNMQRYKV